MIDRRAAWSQQVQGLVQGQVSGTCPIFSLPPILQPLVPELLGALRAISSGLEGPKPGRTSQLPGLKKKKKTSKDISLFLLCTSWVRVFGRDTQKSIF